MRTDCATGWDGISPKIIKLCKLAISSGIFPGAFKKAIVHPVHKNGAANGINNYRPISVLPALSKVLERMMNNSLNSLIALSLEPFGPFVVTAITFKR